MPIKGMRVAAMLAATAALTVAACGGEDSTSDRSGASGGSGEPVTLKVGVLPIADLAPLYLGMDQGFFKART